MREVGMGSWTDRVIGKFFRSSSLYTDRYLVGNNLNQIHADLFSVHEIEIRRTQIFLWPFSGAYDIIALTILSIV